MKYNIKEFRQLILRYESITLGEIKKVFDKYEKKYGYHIFSYIKRELTGFGSVTTCILCRTVYFLKPNCQHCLHYKEKKEVEKPHPIKAEYMCRRNSTSLSYKNIQRATTPEELLKAYKERAKDLRSLLSKLGYKQPEKHQL